MSGLEVFSDYGSTTTLNGTATHNLTMYRAPSGARVFGAGTVQWAWGLDDWNPDSAPPDRNMEQAILAWADRRDARQISLSSFVPFTRPPEHSSLMGTVPPFVA